MKDIYTLGIESSCDETSASIVKNGREVLSNVINSQIEIHKQFGGVVPEIASRNHIEAISSVVQEAIDQAKMKMENIDLVDLRFSFISYKTQEVKVDGRKTINIRMEDDVQALNEVVVIGYGTLDKKELTSAVSHISSKDFLHISSLDPSMMIQGKVAGVSVTNTAAADPNNQASIQIRGISSRAAGLGPLIVIDGIPGGNLTNINPNDIASMDILKDGAASAIYGTRGSNGVIVITTKKGSRDGKFHATYNGMLTASIPLHELDQLTAEEFREYRVPNNPTSDLGGATNWIDEITRTGFTHQHTVT